MAHQLHNLETIIKSCLKPGYTVSMHHSGYTASISMRFHNTINNTYQLVQISDEMTYMGPESIIDFLTTSTNCMAIAPLYQRVFDHLMYEIQWHEFTPGKIWG